MNQDFIEGSISLMHAAMACVMEKAGITDVTISREELATAYERMTVTVRQGVMTGMSVSVAPKRIESTDEAPSAEPTSYKPALTADSVWQRMDDYAQRRTSPENIADVLNVLATQSAAEPAALTLDAGDIEFLAARLRRLFAHFNYRLPAFAKDDKHLIGIAPTCIGAVLANVAAPDRQGVALSEEQAYAAWSSVAPYGTGLEPETIVAFARAIEKALSRASSSRAEVESTPTLDNQYAEQAAATGPKLCRVCHGVGWVRP